MDVSIMIEGQDGLSWPRWQRLAQAAEELGFDGLYRSDHFTNPGGPYLDAIETWTSFMWLATNTSRITFGPLVSPVSFRHPSILAWQASTIDALAGGRLRIGLGAGWQEREHDAFGFDLLETGPRFTRLEEAIQVVKSLTRSAEPVSFEGEYYTLQDAMLMPRSPRADGPAITIGGNGPRRTLPLVAKYADEWNGLMIPVPEYQERNRRLDELLEREGRTPSDVKRTLMTRGLIGTSEADIKKKMDAETLERFRSRGAPVGTANEIVDILGRYAEGGVQGVMLQWMDLDDISGLEMIASEVLPHVGG